MEGEAASSPQDGSDLEKIYLLCLDHDKEKKKRKRSDAFLLCLCFDVCVVVLCVCMFDFFFPKKSNICMQEDESCSVFHHYERPKCELGDLNHSNSVNEGKEQEEASLSPWDTTHWQDTKENLMAPSA